MARQVQVVLDTPGCSLVCDVRLWSGLVFLESFLLLILQGLELLSQCVVQSVVILHDLQVTQGTGLCVLWKALVMVPKVNKCNAILSP